MEPKSNTQDITLPNKEKAEKYIIGIGASAGGIGAIHELFDNVPNDSVSYVIVQHLSPDYQSLMKELLAKHSKLKIYRAENGMEVMSNCVYVLPEGKFMTIVKRKLILRDRTGSMPNSAVDIFFNSLAEDIGNKSIGIVLSGNGADGTKGVAAIKKVGGMVIVQEPSSCEYNSMPQNAIESGYYDYILPPNQIPLQIIKYIKKKTLDNKISNGLSDKDESAFSGILNLIKDHTPLDFSDYKRPTIIRRITRRMLANDVETMDEYIKILKSDSSEIDILSKDFLISVTGFFRDRDAFEIIANKVIPEIVERKLIIDVLKVWVIGCATGEEAYSLAILIKEHLIEIKKDIEVKIFASDIDENAIKKASRGCYSENISKNVSEERLNNFFIKYGEEYQVKDNIRKMIIFAKHDIIHQPPYGRIDLISCRNLMIYFNATLQQKIFDTINYCLNPEGFLFLGPSEGLGNIRSGFEEVDKKWKIFQLSEGKKTPFYNTYTPKHLEVINHSYSAKSLKPLKANLPDNLSKLLNESSMEEAGFVAGVCVDENNKVLLPFGDFDKYLLPKLFKDNLLELLPEELAIAAGTTIKKALKENINVAVRDITFQVDQGVRSVNILAKPIIYDPKSSIRVISLYFAEGEIASDLQRSEEVYNRETHANRYVEDLEEELADTKKKLQEAHESLDESYHNIQSYNEELLSGNEEMQSSNEELQSINEELNTVNLEYQNKIKELAELNDDLDNYFKSTHIAQVYVDQNITLKKYTPVTIKQINIKESDIGRPLADISTNIRFSSLIEDIIYVRDTQRHKEKNIETIDGKSYTMIIVPYIRSQDHTADGVIITFNDITEITQQKRIIQEANRKLKEINKDQDTFIYSASHDLRAPLNNMEGLLSHIKSSTDLEEIKDLTVPLIESVIRLKETISELSKITRIDQEIEPAEKVNLLDLLKEVKLSINDSLVSSKAKIWVDLKVNEVHFSKKNLRSIILNLLSNAIKYRSPDRELSILMKSKRVEDTIALIFEDNGIGIKENRMDELFSKFRRVHEKEVTAEGTGIGLYLIKKIITNAGGRIRVDSEYGHGTTFTVFINQKKA